MKAWLRVAMCILLGAGLLVLSVSAADEPSAWAKNDVEEGIALGFVPQDLQSDYQAYITREEITALAVEYLTYFHNMDRYDMLDLYCYTYEKEVPVGAFTDLSEARYAEHVYQATAMGLVQGRGNGIFDPHAPVTREEAACIFAAVYTGYLTGYKVAESDFDTLQDVNEISRWAMASVRVMYWAHLMHGTANGIFSPKDLITREQCLAVFSRMYRMSAYRRSSGLMAFDKMVAQIYADPSFAVKATRENENCRIIYGVRTVGMTEQWSLWIVYQDRCTVGGRRNIIDRFGETQLEDFTFDETGTVLYCRGASKYRVDLATATVTVMEE